MDDIFQLQPFANSHPLAAELAALEEFEEASSGALDPELFRLEELEDSA